jgi:hypothetical protein
MALYTILYEVRQQQYLYVETESPLDVPKIVRRALRSVHPIRVDIRGPMNETEAPKTRAWLKEQQHNMTLTYSPEFKAAYQRAKAGSPKVTKGKKVKR